MRAAWNRIPATAALLLLLAPGAGCRAMMRYPAEEPDRAPWTEQTFVDGMNGFLLTDIVASRLVVEVDWVEGDPPSDKALSAMEATLTAYCPEGKQIRVERDDEIPFERWKASSEGRRGAEEIAAEFLDHDPANWNEEEVLYVLYVPHADPWFDPGYFGLSTRLTFERGGEPRTARALLVFSERMRKGALLWITQQKVEQATLVHELGHGLGLVSNPGHVQRDNPHHCTEPQCVMTQPKLRSILYGAAPALFTGHIPRDFCKRCREDIETARRTWEIRIAVDPDYAETMRRERRIADHRAAASWYLETERPQRAVAMLERALEIGGDDGSLARELDRAQTRLDSALDP